MLTGKYFGKFVSFMLMLAISGCTSIQTYGLDQMNSDLPVKVDDRVRIFINNSQLSEFHIIVSAITDESIKGALVSDPERKVSFLWDEIIRMEHRQSDSTETTTLVALLLALGFAAALIVEDISESLGN